MKFLILLDQGKCVEILMARDKMLYEDAVEYLEFNTCQLPTTKVVGL